MSRIQRNKYKRQDFLFEQKRPLIIDKKALFQGLINLLLIGLFVAGPILFYVWTRLEVIQLNYALLDVTQEKRKLFMDHERLKVEMAMLLSPSRLSRVAKKRFKLKNPQRNQIIYMK